MRGLRLFIFFISRERKAIVMDPGKAPKVGGVSEVDGSANTLEIDQLARFAVDEYNKKQNAVLQFASVINAKQQTVAGTVYYITIEVKDGDAKKVYEAKVWVKPWMNFKEVQEFKLVDPPPSAATA